eukprot:snap_masked-scaffold_2-processed-gene-16.2-mRNA-1 protein AED:1.00 eAED:1.00 QI:0/-1/0/0/-1/1/1/0/1032
MSRTTFDMNDIVDLDLEAEIAEIDRRNSLVGEEPVAKADFKLSALDKLARSTVLKTKQHCFGILGFIFFVMFVDVVTGWASIQDVEVDDLFVSTSAASESYDALDDIKITSDTARQIAGIERPFRKEEQSLTPLSLIFETTDNSNIFTSKNLKAICEVERVIFGSGRWKKFCLVEEGEVADGETTVCSLSQFSVSARFYGSNVALEACEELLQENIDEKASELKSLGGPNVFFFDAAIIEDDDAISPRTRSLIQQAGPLGEDSTDGEIFTNILSDLGDTQVDYYEEFLYDTEDDLRKFLDLESPFIRSPLFEDATVQGDVKIRVRYFSILLDVRESLGLVGADAALIMISITFVIFLTYKHTGSLYFAITANLATLGSLPVGLFFQSTFLAVDYFIQFHLAVTFLILGIGSDNALVFFDIFKDSPNNWLQNFELEKAVDAAKYNIYGTANFELEVLIHRLAYTMKLAGQSIFNSSLTTISAFFALGLSPVPAVAGFGVLAACTIFALYLWIYFLFPPFLILLENRKQKIEHNVSKINKEAEMKEEEVEEMHVSLLAKFFQKIYVPMFLNADTKILAYACIAALGTMAIALGTQILNLTAPAEAESSFVDGHMFVGFQEDFSLDFAGSTNELFSQTTLMFGVTGIDRGNFRKLNPGNSRGSATFDDSFDLAPRRNQEFLDGICAELAELTCFGDDGEIEKGCTDKENGLLVFADSIDCLLEDFYVYVEDMYNLTKEETMDLGDDDATTFYEYLEDFSITLDDASQVAFNDGKIAFYGIQFGLTLQTLRPLEEKEPVFDLLFDYVNEKRQEAPEGLKTVRVSNFDDLFSQTEKGLVRGLFTGIGTSLPFIYLVLLYGTDNFYLATYALITILFILFATLGTIDVIGWSLGVAEAVAGSLCLGLSVDYSIHLGSIFAVVGLEGYHSREDRFRLTALRIGPTIVAAFIATAGAAMVMLFCQILFFFKLGALIVLTVVNSVIYALLFYLPLCLVAGPEGESGLLSKFFEPRVDAAKKKFGFKSEAEEIDQDLAVQSL